MNWRFTSEKHQVHLWCLSQFASQRSGFVPNNSLTPSPKCTASGLFSLVARCWENAISAVHRHEPVLTPSNAWEIMEAEVLQSSLYSGCNFPLKAFETIWPPSYLQQLIFVRLLRFILILKWFVLPIPCSNPQPFWHQGPVLWKTIFPWTGVVRGWFPDDSSALQLWCTLFLLHQLHLRSPGIRSRRLGSPDLKFVSSQLQTFL